MTAAACVQGLCSSSSTGCRGLDPTSRSDARRTKGLPGRPRGSGSPRSSWAPRPPRGSARRPPRSSRARRRDRPAAPGSGCSSRRPTTPGKRDIGNLDEGRPASEPGRIHRPEALAHLLQLAVQDRVHQPKFALGTDEKRRAGLTSSSTLSSSAITRSGSWPWPSSTRSCVGSQFGTRALICSPVRLCSLVS